MKTHTNVLCLECGEEIFNPLCPKCLSKEIAIWMEDKPAKIKGIVNNEIKKILKTNKEHDYTKCILCKRKDVFLCPYCFTERIYNQLQDNKIKPALLSEFLTLFNFDLEHTGYSKFRNPDNLDDFDDMDSMKGLGYESEFN